MTNFLSALKARLNDYKKAQGLTYFDYFEVSVQEGSKYAKVFRHEMKNGAEFGSRSLVCFVEKSTGNILKAASFAAPAKGIRGNINSEQNGMEAFDQSGYIIYFR